MSTSRDVEKFDEKLRDDQLFELALSKAQPDMALGALKELSRRRSSLRVDLYPALLEDAQASPRAKKFVIAELGKERLARNQALLLGQLERAEPALRPALLHSLGKIGDEKALQRLEALPMPDDSAGRRSLEFSRSLISYRLRLDRHLIPAPADAALLEVSGGVPFEASAASPQTVRRALSQVKSDLPAVPLARAGAARLTCRESELLLVFPREFLPARALATLGERPALPLVLLKGGLSLDRFILEGYFFTQPQRGGKGVALLGVRPGGELTYVGAVEPDAGGYIFTLRSVETRYAPAIDVQGRFDPEKGAWEFSKAITSPQVAARQKPAVTPQRVSPRF